MKHNTQITAILITMFLVTQLIGLFVINFYNSPDKELPYGMEPPETEPAPVSGLTSLMVAFVFAILLFFILTKIKAERFIRAWFFIVSVIAIGLTLNVVFSKLNIIYPSTIAILIGIPLSYLEIFKKNLLALNLNKLLVYSGISAVFVFFLINVMGTKADLGIIILLLAISLYDMWAVWQSKFMQKMAKYQINKIGIFGGFFIPYTTKKQRAKIKLIKQKYKTKKTMEKHFKKEKIKVNLGILGGGDVVFPIIAAGIFYVLSGLIPALIITTSATLGLLYLNLITKKGKFYPAMPFLTIPMYLGMLINWVVF